MRERFYRFGVFILIVSVLAGGASGAGAGGLGIGAGGLGRNPRAASTTTYVSTSATAEGPALLPCLALERIAEPAGAGIAQGAPTLERYEAERSALPVLANNQILAFYGKPDSRSMGILGEYPKEELVRLLRGYARLYDEENGDAGIVPAFYIIYGTCWPGGEIGYLRDGLLREYIELARHEGFLVFVDHQIGRYPVEEAVKSLLPYLEYPNVHLALDPEWRTQAPMEEIGSVTAEEINAAQRTIDGYLASRGIPGRKMLVLHQFKEKMIEGRAGVRADFERVILVHTADGFGSPELKRANYSYNAKAGNLPVKGFKLFFKTKVKGAGYDEPLLTPPEVLALEPRPSLIIYQ